MAFFIMFLKFGILYFANVMLLFQLSEFILQQKHSFPTSAGPKTTYLFIGKPPAPPNCPAAGA
jgi:hypothetical protein